MGRPSSYTPEIAALICDRLSEGVSLREVCLPDDMPDERTVRRWVLDDVGGFSPQYARAREMQAHALADELLEISDDGSNDWMERKDEKGVGWELNGEHIQRSRLRSDTRKWLLSKMLPKVYGDRLEIDANVRTAVVSAEPLTEDEWLRQQSGRVETAARPSEGAD